MALLPDRSALIEHLSTHSVKRGDFVLKSGRPTTWFLDSKQTACDPDGVVLMTDAALAVIPEDATAIGGITVGADPVAYGIAAVAATRGRRLRSFTIRKEAKDHGVQGRVAGALRPGDRVVVTEDTTSRWLTPPPRLLRPHPRPHGQRTRHAREDRRGDRRGRAATSPASRASR
jgi:orotate phosphoribosyltransferase